LNIVIKTGVLICGLKSVHLYITNREKMNKVLPYIVIAILLGTVTMVVPYVLLEPSDHTSLTEESALIQPSPTETEQPSTSTGEYTYGSTEQPTETEQERAYADGGDVENEESVPMSPAEPEPAESEEIPTAAPELQEPTEEAPEPALSETDLITDSLSTLSSIGLMIIPSFLIALGAFIYLKKRTS
jgi:hypothetical protein